MSVKCRWIRKWAVHDQNHLDAHRRKRIEEHIESCSTCKELIEESVRTDEYLHGVPHLEIPVQTVTGFWEGVYRKITVQEEVISIRHEPAFHPLRPLLVWGIPSMVVCILLFLLILSGKPLSFERSEGFDDPISVQSATIGGKDASISIFHTEEPEMTFLWFETEESINGG